MAHELHNAEQLSRVIAQVAAPAFLLSAVASLLSVLITRMNRVVDRSRSIGALPESERVRAEDELPDLRRRAEFMHRAIFWCAGSGIATSMLVIIAFASALLDLEHERGAAVLFIIAMSLFTMTLIYLAREVRLSAADFRRLY
jgi:hypothetical protein